MRKKLLLPALSRFALGLILVSLLLFLPAGTTDWPWGQRFLVLLFLPMLLAGIVMLVKSPALLEKRLSVREKEGEQKRVIGFSGLLFVIVFVLAGLNRRFLWLPLPEWLSWAASALFLLAYLLFAEVLRENSYLSRTVEVQEGQKIIDTGLYGLVRHPMYSASVLLFLSMPLILGSLPSFLLMLLYLPLIVKRIRNEEEVLEQGLPGYREYKRRVKYRLLPLIW